MVRIQFKVAYLNEGSKSTAVRDSLVHLAFCEEETQLGSFVCFGKCSQ